MRGYRKKTIMTKLLTVSLVLLFWEIAEGIRVSPVDQETRRHYKLFSSNASEHNDLNYVVI